MANSVDEDSLRCSLLGKLCYYETKPELQKSYAIDLLDIAQASGNVEGTYNGYYYLGIAESYLGNHTESLKAFFQCLTYAEKISARAKCEILTAIGDVYQRNADFDNSIEYYTQAIHIFANQVKLSERETEALGIVYLNAGEAYLNTQREDSALSYSIKALGIFEQIDRDVASTGVAYSTGNIGLAYAEKGDHSSAESNIRHAVGILEELKDYYAISIYYTYMADIYLEKNDLKRALQYARESYEMAQEYGLKEQIRDASLKLYELYKVAGDYATALDYHVEYTAYKDSITNRESIQQMANLRTEYEVGQKQAEVDLLTVEQKNQRIILMAVAGFAFILVVLAFIIYKYYQSKARINKVLEQQKAELERLNQTKDKFFSIISHDLRGPVSSFHGISRMIKFLVKSKETDQLLEIADDIDQSVDRLSSLLDNLLTWAMQQQGHFPNVPEKLHLKELTEDLVDTLSTMAKAKNIALSSRLDNDLTLWADRNTTMTILRNLVNNALKFTPEGGEVTLAATEVDGFAEIRVQDTGVGIPREKLTRLFKLQEKKSTYGTSGEKGLGLGLQLVYEFIEMNGGSIAVQSEEGTGTVFTVRLPLFGEIHSQVEVPSGGHR